MKPNNDILEELNELGSPLARIPRSNPFALPEGYFDALPDASLDRIFAEEPLIPAGWPKQSPLQLPASYFEELAPELTELARLANGEELQPGFPKTLPFAVPEGYFDSLTDDIVSLVTVPTESLLAAPQTPYAVPEGYFAGFAEGLMDRIRQGDEATARPTVAQQPQPAAVPARRTISFMPALRWAAAAVLLIGIGFSAITGFQPAGSGKLAAASTAEANLQGQLARLDKSAIADYVEQNIDEFDLETLENYAPAAILNGKSAEQSLRQLDAEDIDAYLNAAGEL